jgi:hypothetical protein
MRCTGNKETVVNLEEEPVFCVFGGFVDATFLYLTCNSTQGGGSTVRRLPKAGGGLSAALELKPEGPSFEFGFELLGIDQGAAVVASRQDGSVGRISRASADAPNVFETVLGANAGPGQVFSGWVDADTYYFIALSAVATSVTRFTPQTGLFVPLSVDEPSAASLLLDASMVYWSVSEGSTWTLRQAASDGRGEPASVITDILPGNRTFTVKEGWALWVSTNGKELLRKRLR